MINLYDKTSNELLGSITEEQLQYMKDQMEEESLEDRDYSITPMEIEYFETHGADPDLTTTLRKALGGRDEVVVYWSRS